MSCNILLAATNDKCPDQDIPKNTEPQLLTFIPLLSSLLWKMAKDNLWWKICPNN